MSFLEGLSPRARTYLQTVGIEDGGARLSDEELRARFAARLAPHHLDALVAFERRWGGSVVDCEERELQLGVGKLLEIGIAPEISDAPPLVLVGAESYADIHLAADGMLWWMGPDRQLAPLASSVEKYLERLAVEEEFRPWREAYHLQCEPRIEELARELELRLDETASDQTFAFYKGERHYAWARLQGTAYQTSRAQLFCRGFDDFMAALRLLARSEPRRRCSVLATQPGVREERLDAAEAPSVAALEEQFAGAVRFDGVEAGTAVFVVDDRVEAYETLDDGSLKTWQTVAADGGRYRWYLMRWG